MSKVVLLSVCLVVLLGVAGYSVFAIKDHRMTTIDIKLVRLATADSELASMANLGNAGREVIYYLAKPGTQRVLAVVDVRKDGRVVLNPRYAISKEDGLDYGPIPDLPDFTLGDAEKIFGKVAIDESVPDEIKCSYSLVSVPMGETAGSSNSDITLDLIFFKEKLHKYRVSTNPVKQGQWFTVGG